jgi:hypothetical protein
MSDAAAKQAALRLSGRTSPGIDHIEGESPGNGRWQPPGYKLASGESPQSRKNEQDIANVVEGTAEGALLVQSPG